MQNLRYYIGEHVLVKYADINRDQSGIKCTSGRIDRVCYTKGSILESRPDGWYYSIDDEWIHEDEILKDAPQIEQL